MILHVAPVGDLLILALVAQHFHLQARGEPPKALAKIMKRMAIMCMVVLFLLHVISFVLWMRS